MIMGTLAASSSAIDFMTLLEALQLSKGNLSSHLRKLEEDGLLRASKNFVDRKPRSTYGLTPQGRTALRQHLQALEKLLASVSGTKK